MRRLILAGISIVSIGVLAVLASCGATAVHPGPTRASQLHQPGLPVHRPSLRIVPVPAGAGPEAKGDGLVQAGGASCGRERWSVKTATDPAAGNINLTPQPTTIEALDALPSTNPGNPDQPRDSAVESTVYTITATLEAAKLESDSDIHLALSDGQGHTMIAEIPKAPACTEPPVTERVSVLEQQIEQARNQFVQEFGEPSSTSFTPIGHQVTVTGVGFFDVPHGQRNVAPNAAELHPVIGISDP